MFLIDVDGFTIWGERQHRTPSPVFLSEDGFTGWDDTPDLRRESTVRAGAHGEFDAAGLYAARTASFSGHVVTGSAAETAAIGRRMRGLLAGGQMGRVTVHRDELVEWADGRLASQVKFTQHGSDPTVADWQMQFWFPDPYKYGGSNHVQSDSVGFAVVSHYGNAEAASRLSVTGSAPGWDVTARGMTVSVTRPLQAGQTHVYDLRTGLLTINGSPAPAGSLDEADTWTVPAGDVIGYRLHVGSGNGTLDVYTFDTYI